MKKSIFYIPVLTALLLPAFAAPKAKEAQVKAFLKPFEGEEPKKAEIPVITKDEPIPEIQPYKSVYLLDYAELEDEEDTVPESAFNPNAGRYQFVQNADKRDSDGRTLLMKAARAGNISMIENLLYSQADVNAEDNDGWTALMFAARFQSNPKAVELLIDAGADISAENNYGVTALLLAAGFSKSTNVISALLDKRSIAEKEVLAAFIYAVTNQAPETTLQLFIEKNLAINAPYEGKTPLMYAAETNTDTKTINWLLQNGARTRYKTANGMTAFDYARANKRLPRDKVYWSLNTNGVAR
ncbi:MAG: ankyrin repeat domain-containing protein [Treponema sp.]|nr:ankyrin repeat domain-containing protein [Treponema sp.]